MPLAQTGFGVGSCSLLATIRTRPLTEGNESRSSSLQICIPLVARLSPIPVAQEVQQPWPLSPSPQNINARSALL